LGFDPAPELPELDSPELPDDDTPEVPDVPEDD
jgi:hypothetical protein